MLNAKFTPVGREVQQKHLEPDREHEKGTKSSVQSREVAHEPEEHSRNCILQGGLA